LTKMLIYTHNYLKIGFPKGACSLWQGVQGTASPDISVLISQGCDRKLKTDFLEIKKFKLDIHGYLIYNNKHNLQQGC